jgi:ribosomal protein S18 acetylase RimI-like enzyme
MEPLGDIPVTIRPFKPDDSLACRALYHEGLLGSGKIAENDTGFDIDDIEVAYMKQPGNCFFVAVDQTNAVVGMIGVAHYEDATGEIRRLRVAQECQRRGIGSKLMEAALKFCQDHNYLKVTLDTFMNREPALKLFEKFRFKHSRSRQVNDKELMYFYLDLYTGEARESRKM